MSGASENRVALFNVLGTLVVAAVNFWTIPIFTQLLGPGGYGLTNIYIAWVQIFGVFIGLKAEGSIGSAKANLPAAEQDSYDFSVLVLQACAFVVVLFACLINIEALSFWLNMSHALIICMLVQSFGASLISVFVMRAIFDKRAQKNFLITLGLALGTASLSVGLMIFLFENQERHLGRVYGLVIPNAVLGLALVAWSSVSGTRRLNLKYWRFCLPLTIPLIFHGLSQLVLAQTGKIALQNLYGNEAAGVYSIAVVIAALLGSIYSALNSAFVPFMYDDLAGRNPVDVMRRHFINYSLLFTLGTCAFALIGPELLKWMSPPQYWSAAEVLPMLIVGQYCVFLYSFSVNYQFFIMKTSAIALGTLLAAVLNIALTVTLTPTLGAVGAALATMIAYLALFLFHLGIVRYAFQARPYPASIHFAGLVLVGLACSLYYALSTTASVRWGLGLVALGLGSYRVIKTRTIF